MVIGRAYVRRRSRLDPMNHGDRMQPPDGYDSVYIHEDGDDGDTFNDLSLADILEQERERNVYRSRISHTYAIFSNEKIQLLY